MISKKYRISHQEEYQELYKKGKKFTGKYIIVYIKGNNLHHNRFGIVVSKKVGNAVIRNRAKRQIRAVIQEINRGMIGSNDMVVIAKSNISKSSYCVIKKDFCGILRKAGLCSEN
ncbi:MAG: ribonuclease P protein component [Syntrophomonadaceae bacterium]|jgi:ribonuclease P protein component